MTCQTETYRRAGAWWFRYTTEDDSGDECGPYATKQDAEDDARGVVRFYQRELNRRLKR